ncbi:NADPH-dependent FMN reductase [Sporosarcina sp.]|uniref:NADPH-dependent FMN reductase n=1 Tax=Sporosarcina sp. TaxID=49982 RepID=UPI00260E4821|nr:NADPH-dependent FMN reductase [Sporosarcina sp.]
MTIKVKAIIGSTSSTSYNLKLVNFMAKRYEDKLNIIPVLINDLDMFSIDTESEPSAAVRAFKDDVKDSDAVLFATPEYNFSIPGAMKNALDWLSRGGDFTLNGKPGFIVGASMGMFGSIRAQIHLREILSNPALAPILLPGNEVYVGAIQNKLNEAGDIIDEATITFLDTVVENFITFYRKQKAAAEA